MRTFCTRNGFDRIKETGSRIKRCTRGLLLFFHRFISLCVLRSQIVSMLSAQVHGRCNSTIYFAQNSKTIIKNEGAFLREKDWDR